MPHPMPTDEEVLEFIRRCDAFYPPDAADLPIEENRDFYDRFAEELRGEPPKGVNWHDFEIADNGRMIPARRYCADAAREASILYLHGGGFVLGGLESHHDACLGLCTETGLDVVSIAYRLAPEHLHPAQIDDCERAFEYLAGEGRPIIVAGDSAGANLAAGLCLRRRDKGGPAPIGQVLIYPGLGGDVDRGSYIENADAPMLTRADCLAYAAMRTGRTARDNENDPELAPLKAASFAGLPPAFIVSADIDPLRDDARDYALKLHEAGVAAEWRNEPQLVHGFLRARHISWRAKASFAAICKAISHLAGIS